MRTLRSRHRFEKLCPPFLDIRAVGRFPDHQERSASPSLTHRLSLGGHMALLAVPKPRGVFWVLSRFMMSLLFVCSLFLIWLIRN